MRIVAVVQDHQPELVEALAGLNVDVRSGCPRNDDFALLAGARVIVAAPSSFSFLAALASRGVAMARYPWWHHVPADGRWVRLDAEGSFEGAGLTRAFSATT